MKRIKCIAKLDLIKCVTSRYCERPRNLLPSKKGRETKKNVVAKKTRESEREKSETYLVNFELKLDEDPRSGAD